MNRLIIIGNGFDLAHGLPTSYKDFINWYWDKRVNEFYGNLTTRSSDVLCQIIDLKGDCWNVNHYCGMNLMKIPGRKEHTGEEIFNHIRMNPDKFKIEFSPFFENIIKSIETKNWVDIEEEYYRLLKKYSIEEPSEDNLKALNEQMQYLQKLLVEYLKSVDQQQVNLISSLSQAIVAPINYDDLSVEGQRIMLGYIEYCINNPSNDDHLKEVLMFLGLPETYYHYVDEIREKYNKYKTINTGDYSAVFRFPENVMLLNFNYTSTVKRYISGRKGCVENHIHGEIDDPQHIIFGYGDELDENYKELQKLNNNECLQKIKSIRYLEAPNYKAALRFIESAPFQVYIMGHSCGNSDRTLLNTIFEHKNCVSIKTYYYLREDGTDDYIEKVQNISRNFTDMKLMRDRVVDKSLCSPLGKEKK